MRKNKLILAFLLFILSICFLTGQVNSTTENTCGIANTSETTNNASVQKQDPVEKAVDSINKNLILNDSEKAYSYARFIIKLKKATLDAATINALERAVSSYSTKLVNDKNWKQILIVEKEIENASESVKSKIASAAVNAKEQIEKEALEAEKAKQEELRLKEEQRIAEQQKKQLEELSRMMDKQSEIALQRDKIEQEARNATLEKQHELEIEKEKLREQERTLLMEQQAKKDEMLTEMVKTINKQSSENINTIAKSNTAVVVGLGIVALFVIAGVILIVFVSLKQQKIQQEQFKHTLQTMQAMRTIQPNFDMISLPFSNDAEKTNALPDSSARLMIEDSGLDSEMSENLNGTEDDKMSVFKLLKVCQKYGAEIDKATGRRNASRLVSDLVYKIAKQMGYSEHDSIVFFSIGLVYDIGFLSIDSSILRAECLTKDQFEVVKTHTTAGLNMVFFVEEKYRPLFRDGVSKHHENLDGTGYPHGLKENDIPYIARVLRVVESYIALISKRDYREIKDRNAAIQELKESPNQYDQQIVDALDVLV